MIVIAGLMLVIVVLLAVLALKGTRLALWLLCIVLAALAGLLCGYVFYFLIH